MPRRPAAFHACVSFGIVAVLAVALWAGLSQRWLWAVWLGCWFLAINVVTMAYYGYDKFQARRGGRRIPEVVLHALAILGGSLGAFAGQQLFRHKTVKGSFRIVFWFIVIVQTGLIVWMLVRLNS